MAGVGILSEFHSESGNGKIEVPNGVVDFHVKNLINGGENDLVQWGEMTYELDSEGNAKNVDLTHMNQFEGIVKEYDDGCCVGVITMDDCRQEVTEVTFFFKDIFRNLPEQLVGEAVTFNLRRGVAEVSASNVRFPNLRWSFGQVIKLKRMGASSNHWGTVQPDCGGPSFEFHSIAVANPECLKLGSKCTYVLRRMHDTGKQRGKVRADVIHISARASEVCPLSAAPAEGGLLSGPIFAAGLETIATGGPASTRAPRAPSSSSSLRGPVYLLEFGRSHKAFFDALVQSPFLEFCRCALEFQNRSLVLPSGAKIFVFPDQFDFVGAAVSNYKLKPRHVIVAQEFEADVMNAVAFVGFAVHEKSRALLPPTPAVVSRTLIEVRIPSSLRSEPLTTAIASTTDANPRVKIRPRKAYLSSDHADQIFLSSKVNKRG